MTGRVPRWRILAAVCALMVPLWVVNVVPKSTSAGWTDREYATGSFQAIKVKPPILTSCRVDGLLFLFNSVNITFNLPEDYPDKPRDLSWTAGSSQASMSPVASPTIAGSDGGPYTATFERSLLGSLLGGVFFIGAQTRLDTSNPNSWTSVPAQVRVGSFVLGLGRRCDPITPAE